MALFPSSLQPSLDNVDSVDSGHGTSAASSAGGGVGGILVAHPSTADRDRPAAAAAAGVVDCPSAEAATLSLANSSYVKIPPIDAFLASLTATTVSVSPPAADPAAAPAAESGSLSSPTFATFHPGGRVSGGRSGGSPNNNGKKEGAKDGQKKFLGFHFLPAINLTSLSPFLSCRRPLMLESAKFPSRTPTSLLEPLDFPSSPILQSAFWIGASAAFIR